MTTRMIELSAEELTELISSTYAYIIQDNHPEVVRNFVENSTLIWGWFDEEELVGFWGIMPASMISDRAYLWLCSTPKMLAHSLLVVRRSKKVIAKALEQYPLLVGHTLACAEGSIRWLKWLGAEYGPPIGEIAPFEIRATR